MSNIPIKHHYIPEFYLKRWALADGKLCEFSKPFGGIVKPRRVYPAQTGFESRLYEARVFEDARRGYFESDFLKSVDSKAAEALEMLEQGATNWNNDTRSAWTRFMMSVLLRTPDDISALKAEYARRWADMDTEEGRTHEQEYLKIKSPDDPPTLREFVATVHPDAIEFYALKLFANMLNLASMGERIMNMDWVGLHVLKNGRRFITSDRPFFMSALGKPPAYVTLPISPTTLFIGHDKGFDLASIVRADRDKVVELINRETAERASRHVWATGDYCLRFVQKNFGVKKAHSMFASRRPVVTATNLRKP